MNIFVKITKDTSVAVKDLVKRHELGMTFVAAGSAYHLATGGAASSLTSVGVGFVGAVAIMEIVRKVNKNREEAAQKIEKDRINKKYGWE